MPLNNKWTNEQISKDTPTIQGEIIIEWDDYKLNFVHRRNKDFIKCQIWENKCPSLTYVISLYACIQRYKHSKFRFELHICIDKFDYFDNPIA